MNEEIPIIQSIIQDNAPDDNRQKQVEKYCPATGKLQSIVACAGKKEVERAVKSAELALPNWSRKTAVERGLIVRTIAQLFSKNADQLKATVSRETGKSQNDAGAELEGAIEMAYFIAGEGRRLYGKATTSAVPNRQALILRQPLGVVTLIVASNTPIANIAWKLFPALIAGNTVVMKASENTPKIAQEVFEITQKAGLPRGVFNLLQGSGDQTGQLLVEHQRVSAISFTGSSQVGRQIASSAGKKLQKICLELGGKNPFIVCKDADFSLCLDSAILSAFSNAGQRCAAASRFIIVEDIYDQFVQLLVERTKRQSVGTENTDDFGPVINHKQLQHILAAISKAKKSGANVLTGGERIEGGKYESGFYMQPTLIENVSLDSEIATTELFGPVATVHKVKSFPEAIEAANSSPYGLTAALWTNNIHKAQEAIACLSAGVVSINGPTYGSEPHMPFGGLRSSGNGWREAGTEAIDFYTEIKSTYINHSSNKINA